MDSVTAAAGIIALAGIGTGIPAGSSPSAPMPRSNGSAANWQPPAMMRVMIR